MRVSRRGHLYIATRITGSTHHFLGLDFSIGIEQYAEDLSGNPSPATALFELIFGQVAQVFLEENVSESALSGIQFDGRDAPCDSTYLLLTREILASRKPVMERPPTGSLSPANRLAEHRQR